MQLKGWVIGSTRVLTFGDTILLGFKMGVLTMIELNFWSLMTNASIKNKRKVQEIALLAKNSFFRSKSEVFERNANF